MATLRNLVIGLGTVSPRAGSQDRAGTAERMAGPCQLSVGGGVLHRHLIELLELDTWIEGIGYLLPDILTEGAPMAHYRGKDQGWL